MFGIRINMEDELSSGMYRNNNGQSKTSNANCTVEIIQAHGFSFKQALVMFNKVAPRRELNAIYQENCFRITREQILNVVEKYNIEI